MNTQEIRAKALELAVTQSVAWQMEASADVLALANIFQDYIAHGPKPVAFCPPVAPRPRSARRCTHQTADGRQCTRPETHTGLHLIGPNAPETQTAERILEATEEVQHVDHDGDWGPLCGFCGHRSGVHTHRGGCLVFTDGAYCPCAAYLKPEAAA